MATLIVTVFLVFFAISMLAFVLGGKLLETSRKKKFADTLSAADKQPAGTPGPAILMAPEEEPDSLVRFARRFNFTQRLEVYFRQGGQDWTLGKFALLTLACAAAGLLIGYRVHVLVYPELSMAVCTLGLACIPYLVTVAKRNGRLNKFEEQFPGALDFLARSMRAGHAFSVSLEMLAEEAPDPLGMEFRQATNEHNLGAPIDVALGNLADRVPLVDVGFFAAAVTLQRETGGNLSELLMKLSYLIRERFRLKRQVRGASAHGRLTALILVVMPFLIMLGLMTVSPDYLPSMAADPDGKYLIAGAILAQLLGYLVIRKIVNIKI
jgi:tight adherence protein B